jgi:hypothetical protein
MIMGYVLIIHVMKRIKLDRGNYASIKEILLKKCTKIIEIILVPVDKTTRSIFAPGGCHRKFAVDMAYEMSTMFYMHAEDTFFIDDIDNQRNNLISRYFNIYIFKKCL